jgi:hypothetical protein
MIVKDGDFEPGEDIVWFSNPLTPVYLRAKAVQAGYGDSDAGMELVTWDILASWGYKKEDFWIVDQKPPVVTVEKGMECIEEQMLIDLFTEGGSNVACAVTATSD